MCALVSPSINEIDKGADMVYLYATLGVWIQELKFNPESDMFDGCF